MGYKLGSQLCQSLVPQYCKCLFSHGTNGINQLAVFTLILNGRRGLGTVGWGGTGKRGLAFTKIAPLFWGGFTYRAFVNNFI